MTDDGSNPLENADVKQLLKEADNINSKHDFQNWQKSFLDAFTKFLDSDGSDKAKEAYAKFSTSSTGLFKVVKSLTDHIEEGTLSKERTSVKARRAITELGTVLNKLVEALQLILPTTSQQITKFGFTKYHMGAVLVEDGFKEYAVMQYCQKLLRHLRVQALDQLASRQVLDEIDYFGSKFSSFCGVMESLNLMNVCKIAEKFLHSDLAKETEKVMGELQEAAPEKPPADLPVLEKKKEFTVTVTQPGGPRNTKKSIKADSPKKSREKKDDASTSSYEEIQEIITVSSYETVEVADDSSYETINIVEESEYTTDEEEVIVSDYVTDSSDSSIEQTKKNKPKSKKKKGSKPITKKKEKKNAPSSPPKQSSPSVGKANGGSSAQPKKAPAKSSAPQSQSDALPPPENTGGENQDPGEKYSDEEEDPDSNNSSDSEKKHGDKNLPDVGSDSESSGNGNIKARAAKAPDSLPASPTANEKPVERISFTAKDFYHGHSNNDCFNVWKEIKKERSDENYREEKRKKRIERTEIVTTRRKIKDREVKTIRQKKEKPPKIIRVRHTKNVVQKKLVKKEKLVQ
mmetsp:Transcript_12816/g.24641  ORF Transcript_12816/g.24641 Transcript_12816/m.24641 type:complete len:574 (+) Transcript_12816:110-1831(+)